MKRIRFFIVLAFLLAFTNLQGVAATKAGDTAADSRKAHFILSARAGSAFSTDFSEYTTAGVGVALGGAMEFPMNAKKTWHASIGVNFANTNIGYDLYAEALNGEKLNATTHSFLLQVPILFSYTKPLDDRCRFRVSFGLFLSQLLGGIENIRVPTNVTGTYHFVSSQFSTPLNVGFSAGTGFFFGNYYVGTNFTFLFDSNLLCVPALNAVLGYRF